MSDDKKPDAAPKYAKGDRAAIASGKQGVGIRGEIFWLGPNKYGPGHRYGLRGDNGETYWVDEASLGPEADAPEAPKVEREAKPALAKGQRVMITRGAGKGTAGEVFWTGDSKFGNGMRYGVRADDEQTYWVDDHELEVSTEPAPERAASAARADQGGEFSDASEFSDDGDAFAPEGFTSSSGSPGQPAALDEPFPGDDDFSDEAAAPDFGDEDVPF